MVGGRFADAAAADPGSGFTLTALPGAGVASVEALACFGACSILAGKLAKHTCHVWTVKRSARWVVHPCVCLQARQGMQNLLLGICSRSKGTCRSQALTGSNVTGAGHVHAVSTADGETQMQSQTVKS